MSQSGVWNGVQSIANMRNLFFSWVAGIKLSITLTPMDKKEKGSAKGISLVILFQSISTIQESTS